VPRSKTPIISLEEAKARFEEWRQTRKGKAAIPDELWAAAAQVARREGVSRTSTDLRIEWNELKRRMTAAAGVSRQTAPPAFVELVAPQSQSLAECMIELEGRRGKLRIQLKGASASYVATLSRKLWEPAP
jgi:acyl-CoA synthetase (AMP-forming)/AMP-acid ligase II